MTALTIAQRHHMVEQNLQLIPWTIWQYRRLNGHDEGFHAFRDAATAAMVRAANAFDPDRHMCFSTLAVKSMKNAICEEVNPRCGPCLLLPVFSLTRACSSIVCSREQPHDRR